MKTAYLDNNIFIYLEEGKLDIANLKGTTDPLIETFSYSHTHIQETRGIMGDTDTVRRERIKTRLNTIKKYTSSYLYVTLENEMIHEIKDPTDFYSDIDDLEFSSNVLGGLMNAISESQKNEIRKELDIDPFKINNYKHDEVIMQLNKKVYSHFNGMSFLELLASVENYYTFEMGLKNRVAGIFEYLDFLGYWKDTYTTKSNAARLWDSMHTVYASECDYFISDDKRTRNKARVAYDIYGIQTIVVSSNGEK